MRPLSKYIHYLLFGATVLLTTWPHPNIFTDSHILPFWYCYVTMSFVWGIAFILFRKGIALKLSAFSLSLFILMLYICIHSYLTGNYDINCLTIPCFFLLFVVFQSSSTDDFNVYKRLIIIATFFQATYGILQYIHIFPNHTQFPIIGRFDNPAGFASCMIASLPFCLFSCSMKNWWGIFSIVCTGLMYITIILSGSRTGILCAIVLGLVYYGNMFLKVISRKMAIFAGVALVIGLAAILGVAFKQDSAIGRLLIWNNTIEMWMDASIGGHGAGAFQAKYMNYQAEFFANNPTHKYSDLADNVMHPFNEYLLLLVEHGILGALLLALVVIITLCSQKRLTPFLLSLAGIGCFALFSYPLGYSYQYVIMALCCGYLAKDGSKLRCVKISMCGRLVIAMTSVIFLGLLFHDMSFEYRWNRVVQMSRQDKGRTLRNYSKLYASWNKPPLFLYNYGVYLNSQGQYNESNRIFSECKQYFNDYDVQMLMGRNHLALMEWNAAEKAFTQAHYMIPNRFMPLYCLVELHERNNNAEKADSIALIILNKPIKIESPQIDMIISKMKSR